jgi:peptide/nickel transport system substrate-binding protein
MLTRRHALLAAASITTLPGVTQAQAQAQPKTAIAVRIDRDVEVLDPAFRSGLQDGNIIRAVFQRLYTVAPNGELVPDAASELKQVSPTEVDFTLKPGQLFTDGFGEMTAEDVKFSFERFAIAPLNGKESPYKGDWASLKGVEVTGQYTGRITLDKPRAALMAVAIGDVSGSIVCKRAVEQRGPEHNTRPVGSGPLLVASFEKQRGVVLKRNPQYAGAKSGFEEVAVRYVQDPKTTELGLRSGELDFALLPPQAAEPLRSVQGLNVTQQPGIANVWIGLNIEKKPFDDIRVRRAFHMALDVDQMLLAGYNGKAPRANALVMPQVLGHWKDAPVWKRDVAGAKKLLAEAGLPSGFKCKMVIQNQPVYQTMALVARALLAEAGIQLEVDAQESGAFFSAGKGEAGKALDTVMIRFNGKMDPNFLAQWFTTSQIGIWNWQRWSDPKFDSLLDQASAELDPARRAGLIVEAQQRMEESACLIWLTYDVSVFVARNWLKPALLPSGIDWALDRFAPA